MKFRLTVPLVMIALFLAIPAVAEQAEQLQTAKVVITKSGFEPGSLKLKANPR